MAIIASIRRPIGIAVLLALAVLLLVAAQPEKARGRMSSADEQVALSTRALSAYKQRVPARKPVNGLAHAAGFERLRLSVKFQQGSVVRLRSGKFASLNNDNLTGLQTVMAKYPGAKIDRMISQPELAFARDRARLEDKTRQELGDMNLWYDITLPKGSKKTAAEVANELNALGIVEVATPHTLPEPSPVGPDLRGDQGYKDAAPVGIGSLPVHALPGGTGANVRIIDIEYSWNTNHEDLTKTVGARINNGTPSDPFNDTNHGTAVLGEMIADNNSFGVTGIAYGADIRLINQYTTSGQKRAEAINLARLNTVAGDVILLEMQTQGPNGGCNSSGQTGCAPVEWVQSIYDAIKLTTAEDTYVVEAAGNGSQDLDSAAYNNAPWELNGPSGAFIIGAGGGDCQTNRKRLSFSNYGSIINLQGWGGCVTTTGYGGAHGSSQSNDAYTTSFSGTSSASPIVAGAVALHSSVEQAANGQNVVTFPGGVLFILAFTASPQVDPSDGQIGGLPNLRRALRLYDNVAPLTPSGVLTDAVSGSFQYTKGQVTAAVSGSDNFEIKSYRASEDASPPAWNSPGWQSSSNVAVNLSPGDGSRTVYFWTQDYNRNVSPAGSDTIVMDQASPTSSIKAPPTNRDGTVNVKVSGTDATSGVLAYYAKANDTTPPDPNDPGWSLSSTITVPLSGPSGLRNVYGWTKDYAGNVSSRSSDTLLYDGTKPTVTISTPPKGSTVKKVPALRGKTTDDLPPQYRRADFALGKRKGGGNCDWWNPNKRQFIAGKCNQPQRFLIRVANNLPNWRRPVRLEQRGNYFVIVRYIDGAGNIGRATTNFKLRP